MLFVYRFKTSLIAIITVNTIKPVLYSMAVKNGTKKIQKAALYAILIRVIGREIICLTEMSFAKLFRSHANRMAV